MTDAGCLWYSLSCPLKLDKTNCCEHELINKEIRKEHKMPYIWINPVVDKMYDQKALEEFLAAHGYQRVHASVDWHSVVKEKYRQVVADSDRPVMDMRCPATRALLYETGVTDVVMIPDIKPILIHCGVECSKEPLWSDREKVIVTPCQALADMGNGLELPNTHFIPWNGFVELLGDEPERVQPKESPIPPGYFDGLGIEVASVSGEEKIRNYLNAGVPDGVQLVEMLFCKEGCHNGDGIKGCRS